MKPILLIAFLFLFITSYGQGTWIQKANFAGPKRLGAVSFSIGTKGFIGLGYDNPADTAFNDFWQWDQATNAWTQKANFGGVARSWAMGFSIGSKGYIGLGFDLATTPTDFWAYDTAANTWTIKANFPGTPASETVGFAIGSKGYIIGGASEFWEYDPATDMWTQKSSYPGSAYNGEIAFSISGKAYVGAGSVTNTTYAKDFWEYNPVLDAWTQKNDFPGGERTAGVGFAIITPNTSRGYIGTGYNGNTLKDLWEYNPANDSWTQRVSFGGIARWVGVGMAIGAKGYIGTGFGATGCQGDFWEYTQDAKLGINEAAKTNTFSIYPNPFSSSTTLHTDKVLNNATLTIYNTTGQLVKQLKNISGQTVTLHRDNLPAGQYSIKVTQYGKIIATEKLIIAD